MALKEIPLTELQSNEYNPRKTFSDAKMQELKESIDKMGLLQPLTVREMDGGHEVIAGSRRFQALQEVEEDDYEVPVQVVEADDEKARLIALSENLERSDLTPVEEAKAFAEYVDVSVSNETVGVLKDSEETIHIRKGDESGLVNFGVYVGYIKGDKPQNMRIVLPTEDGQSMQKASDKIPGVTTRQIRSRLELLLLPNDLLEAVDNGTLKKSVARVLVKFRKLGDVEQMHQEMLSFGKNDKYRGSGVNRNELSDEVDARISEIQNQGEAETEIIETYFSDASDDRGAVEEQLQSVVEETELSTLYQLMLKVENADSESEDVIEGFIEDNPNSILTTNSGGLIDGIDLQEEPFTDLSSVLDSSVPLMERSGVVVDASSSLYTALDLDREDEINDEISSLREERNNVSTTRDWLRNNDSNQCPHCHSQVTAPTLDDEAEQLDSRIESLQSEVKDIDEQRSELNTERKELRSERGDYEDSLEKLLDREVGSSPTLVVGYTNNNTDSVFVAEEHDLSGISEPDESEREDIMEDALCVEEQR